MIMLAATKWFCSHATKSGWRRTFSVAASYTRHSGHSYAASGKRESDFSVYGTSYAWTSKTSRAASVSYPPLEIKFGRL